MRIPFIISFVWLFTFVANAQQRTLDFYIAQATANSPVIKDYAAQLQSADLDSALIDATRKPQVNAVSMVMVAPTYKNAGYDGAVTNGGNYEALASVSQPIFAKKLFAPQYEELRIGKQSLTNSSQLFGHDISRDVTDQFITAYSTFKQYTSNRAVLALLVEEEQILKNLVAHGIYHQADYLAFLLEKQTQQLTVNENYVQYRNDLAQLNVLCGISDTAYCELSAPQIDKPQIQQKGISPFIFQFAIDSFRLVNQRALVDVQYRPHLNWFADAGLLSSSPATLYRNFGLSFGLSFSIPLYDGHQRNIQYQKIAVSESTRMNYRNYFVGQQNMRVLQLRTQIDLQKDLITQRKALLTTSQQLIDLDKALLEKGEASITDYILAIRNQASLQLQLNAAEVSELTLVNQLNYWNW